MKNSLVKWAPDTCFTPLHRGQGFNCLVTIYLVECLWFFFGFAFSAIVTLMRQAMNMYGQDNFMKSLKSYLVRCVDLSQYWFVVQWSLEGDHLDQLNLSEKIIAPHFTNNITPRSWAKRITQINSWFGLARSKSYRLRKPVQIRNWLDII